MNIVIAGAGEVGFHLAKLLADESQDITVIDIDDRNLQYVATHIDVMTIKGSASSLSILNDAGIQNADLFVALTGSEEVNLTACLISKKLGAKKTIARINNTEYLDSEVLDMAELGIDEVISPELLAAKEIELLLKESVVTDKFEFDDGKLSVIGIGLDERSPLVGKSIHQVAQEYSSSEFITVAIHRKTKTIIPRGDVIYQSTDQVYFIVKENSVDEIRNFTGRKTLKIKDIMILGGSKTGHQIAKALCNDYHIKLVEADSNRCFKLADELNKVLVVNGDAHNVDLLKEEGIDSMDTVITATGNSETNIISCLVAKNYNVSKTIAIVENVDYMNLSANVGVDTLINKKLIAANFIFRHIRQGDVISLTGLHGVDAEVLEFDVKEESMITMASIKDLMFPKGAIIGGVIQQERSYIATGDSRIKPGDHVVVFSLPECINKVEEFFK